MESKFFTNKDITNDDKVTGYIYVLSSLSDNPTIKNQKNLYKIGYSTNSVEERIANAAHEPTYLMAPVKNGFSDPDDFPTDGFDGGGW